MLSAIFAALTAIFAKVGVAHINSDLATFIRTCVILLTLALIVYATGQFQNPAIVTRKRGNARGAKGAGHRRWARANWQQELCPAPTHRGSGNHRVLRDRRLQPKQHRDGCIFHDAFALLGYIFRKIDAEPAPMLLGFILGPMMEEFLRRALLLSKGSPLVLVTRPISATMLALSVLALIAVLTPALQKKREEAFHEQE